MTLFGGAAAGWPLAALAQQVGKVQRLGVLTPSAASMASIRSVTLGELAKSGYVEGQNLFVHSLIGTAVQMPELARALIAGNPDVVIAVSDIAIAAIKAVSGSVPIVMSFGTGDPVAAGFAASITRPGGNITGVTMLAPETNAKRLTLLHEAIPKARRIAALTVSADRYEIILRECGLPPLQPARAFDVLRRNRRRLSGRVHRYAVGRCSGSDYRLGARVQS